MGYTYTNTMADPGGGYGRTHYLLAVTNPKLPIYML